MQFFEQYFLNIRACHSYIKMDQSTRKSANSWLKISKDKNISLTVRRDKLSEIFF